jgi:NAD(P)H-dependent FMN reductase
MLLIITASNGKNLELAQHLASLAAPMNCAAQVLDLTELDLPLYTPQGHAQGTPPAVEDLAAKFRTADTFFFCAPEYNGSIPPTLTNAVAWLSVSTDDFRDLFNAKPAAIATHSGGGGSKLLVALRLMLSHLGCNVIGRELLTNPKRPLHDEGALAILEQLAGA